MISYCLIDMTFFLNLFYFLQNGMHSLCPAIWSKHRRWLLMSMVCLNPLACVSQIWTLEFKFSDSVFILSYSLPFKFMIFFFMQHLVHIFCYPLCSIHIIFSMGSPIVSSSPCCSVWQNRRRSRAYEKWENSLDSPSFCMTLFISRNKLIF